MAIFGNIIFKIIVILLHTARNSCFDLRLHGTTLSLLGIRGSDESQLAKGVSSEWKGQRLAHVTLWSPGTK